MSNRKLIYTIAGTFIVMVIAVFSWWARQPSVTTPQASESQVKAATTEETWQYQNDYLSMQIPGRFVAKLPTKGNGKPLYIQQLLTVSPNSGSISSDQLAIVVGVMPSSGLGEVADVQLRARSPHYYQLQNSSNVIAYESFNDARYEISYFVSNQSIYASVVLTTSLDKAASAKEQSQKMVDSITWLTYQ